jgi:hypothetical protein
MEVSTDHPADGAGLACHIRGLESVKLSYDVETPVHNYSRLQAACIPSRRLCSMWGGLDYIQPLVAALPSKLQLEDLNSWMLV